MARRKASLWSLTAAIALVAIVIVGVVAPRGDATSLRATVAFDKAAGRLGDIEWSDLLWVMRPGNGDELAKLVKTENPFEAITSPLRSRSDLEAGERLFRDHCGSCHGDGGRGGPGGPSLPERVFRQGRSDWALYRTITLGIPGTPMLGKELARDDVWRLVSYLSETVLAPNLEVAPVNAASMPARLAPVSATELRNADNDPAEWLTYSGSYSGQRYSRLSEINRDSVGRLRLEWQRQLIVEGGRIETTPLVRGSTMFVTEPPQIVRALDAASGQVLWSYLRGPPTRPQLCCGLENRGVALLGDRVFVGTLDAHLVALDANTGKVVWEVAVADSSNGYSITSAPLAIEDTVIVGVAGGEFGARGFLDAYDAASGKRRWRFYTVPAVGEPGSETWDGDSLNHGGSPTWLTGSFDPESRLIYWGVGNPSPNYYGAGRNGDDLYSNSVIAIDATSGTLRWYFQFTPHDLHDWDAAQIPILVDAVIDNTQRRLLAWANRNGFYYVLDRVTGAFLLGTPFVRQTWADGLDEKGRPHVRPESIPTRQGSLVYPSVAGGTNWWSPSYDPELQLVYVPTIDRGSIYFASPDRPPDELGETLGSSSEYVSDENTNAAVKALDLVTGRVRWQHAHPPRKTIRETGGLMSTSGQLVFGGDDEFFFALDAKTGEELWHFNTGGHIAAAPISYALNGHQYVAIAAGRSILAFALPEADAPTSPPSAPH
jgi:alcohol dehydrogenase (cytochrome c)